MGHRLRDVGGPPGGLPIFALGLGMPAAGADLLTNQVIVHSGYGNFWGQQTFGLTLLPLLFGIGFLAHDRKSGRRVVGRTRRPARRRPHSQAREGL